MNLLNDYNESTDKYDFLTSYYTLIIKSYKNQIDYSFFDNLKTSKQLDLLLVFKNIKQLNYSILENKEYIALIHKERQILEQNDNINNFVKQYEELSNYKQHITEINNELNNYLKQIHNYLTSLQNITNEQFENIINLYFKSFIKIKELDINLIIDEFVILCNHMLNNNILNNKVIEFIETEKNRIFECNFKTNSSDIILQDFLLKTQYYNLDYNNLLITCLKSFNWEKYKDIELEDNIIDLNDLIHKFILITNKSLQIIIIYAINNNVEYKSFSKIKNINQNFIDIQSIQETKIIKNLNKSTNKSITYKLINVESDESVKLTDYLLILESFNDGIFNVLSYKTNILIDKLDIQNKVLIQNLLSKINTKNKLSNRISCYNKQINNAFKSHILTNLNISEFYSFVDTKIIKQTETEFKKLINDSILNLEYTNTKQSLKDLKKKLKRLLLDFFINNFENIHQEQLIVLKLEIKDIFKNIKRDLINDPISLSSSIKFHILKTDNIYDRFIENYSYEKFLNYINTFK